MPALLERGPIQARSEATRTPTDKLRIAALSSCMMVTTFRLRTPRFAKTRHVLHSCLLTGAAIDPHSHGRDRNMKSARLLFAALLLGACLGRGEVVTGPENGSASPAAQSVQQLPTLIITELMGDPSSVLDETGEYIEVFNPGSAAVD